MFDPGLSPPSPPVSLTIQQSPDACGEGPVYKLAFGPRSFIVVSDPVMAKHVLKSSVGDYDKGVLATVREGGVGSILRLLFWVLPVLFFCDPTEIIMLYVCCPFARHSLTMVYISELELTGIAHFSWANRYVHFIAAATLIKRGAPNDGAVLLRKWAAPGTAPLLSYTRQGSNCQKASGP